MRFSHVMTAMAGLLLSQAVIAQEAPSAPPAATTQPAATTPPAAPAPAPATETVAPAAPATPAADPMYPETLKKIPGEAPDPKTDLDNILYLDLSTGGRVAIQLRPDVAPLHVERIKTLVRRGFYNGVIFHRVIEGFMAQTGDPKGTGEGGSDLPDLKAEFNQLPHLRGTVSAARTGEPNTANSQFFIMLMPNLRIDRKYTVFGRVIDGMSYVDAIERGEPPANPSKIIRAALASDTGEAPHVAGEAPKPQ